MALEIVPPFRVTTRISAGSRLEPTDNGLRQLREIVAGRNAAFPRTQAMALLLETDAPTRHRDFEAVLQNESEPPAIRYLAAIYLGRINTPQALQILIQSSQIRDESVLAGVMRALGKIGESTALKVVLQVAERAQGVARSEARLAAALISHRLGLKGHELPVPDKREFLELPTECARPLAIRRADDADAELCLRSLADQPLGIELAESPMYQLRCGRQAWMILINRDFVGADAVKKLTKQKAFLGILAIRSDETKLYSVAYMLLTSPGEQRDTADILLCRTNGALAFGGTIRVGRERAEISIRAVARPGAVAVRVEGAWENGQLAIREAWSTGYALRKKRLAERDENVKSAEAPAARLPAEAGG